MENAVSALKIVFAIFIFILGLSILFFMSSQARETASIIIAGTDKTNDYIYYEDYKEDVKEDYIDKNGNRVVQMKDMIPTIYRYSDENYGVTIVNEDGEIVAKFDGDTENMCNMWVDNRVPKDTLKSFFEKTNNEVYAKVNRLSKNIYPENGNAINISLLDSIEDITTLFKKIYKVEGASATGTIRREYECRWRGQDNLTAQRIDSDLSRNNCKF